jgi:hypothetical protein
LEDRLVLLFAGVQDEDDNARREAMTLLKMISKSVKKAAEECTQIFCPQSKSLVIITYIRNATNKLNAMKPTSHLKVMNLSLPVALTKPIIKGTKLTLGKILTMKNRTLLTKPIIKGTRLTLMKILARKNRTLLTKPNTIKETRLTLVKILTLKSRKSLTRQLVLMKGLMLPSLSSLTMKSPTSLPLPTRKTSEAKQNIKSILLPTNPLILKLLRH